MKYVLVVSSLLALSACATITRGTTEVFTVESTPAGAEVSLSNGMECESTPCAFKVPRKGDLSVIVSKNGYESSEHNIPTQVSGGGGAAMAGNVLVGGLIGAGVDAASGAMLEHKPNPLVVTLTPIDASLEGAVAESEQLMDAGQPSEKDAEGALIEGS